MKYDVRTHAHISMPDIDRLGASFMAVLVKSSVGTSFTAYGAIVKMPSAAHRLYEKAREMKAQRVAALGGKLTFDQARVYFPAIKKSQYNGT